MKSHLKKEKHDYEAIYSKRYMEFLKMNTTKALIFDLDGTILDTLSDLTDAVNHALGKLGFPIHTEKKIRSIVGCGVHNLISRALPENCGEEAFEECLRIFREYYEINKSNKTAPYRGIIEALSQLSDAGYKMAIVSNKHEDAVLGLNKHFFEKYMSVAIGNTPDLPRKPAPDMVNKALALLGATADEAIYIGDSEVDVECAKNSNCRFVGVSWGFRDEDVLISLGATEIAHTPREMVELITGIK